MILRVCFARNSFDLFYFLQGALFYVFLFSPVAVMFYASINCVFFCFISLLMAVAVGESTESFLFMFFIFLSDNFQQLLFSVCQNVG